MTKSRSNSSQRWLNRQHKDIYTAEAKVRGFRSRAAFKLLEIHERDKIFKKGMTVIDLGAAPGGWSQVAAKLVGQQGVVFALDKLPMESLPGVDIIQGDFLENALMEQLEARLFQKVGLVLSDMAPNLSGLSAIDNPRTMVLAEMALEFAERVLETGGTFLVKVFQGAGFQEYCARLKNQFAQVWVRKPKSSRSASNEVYLLAKGYSLSMRGNYIERYA